MDLRKIPLSRLVPELRFQRIDSFCRAVYSDKMKGLTSEFDPAALYVEAFEKCNADNLFDGFLYQQLKVGSQPSIADMPDISGMASSEAKLRSPALKEPGLFDMDRIQVMYEFAKMRRNIPAIWPWNIVMMAQWMEDFL